MRANNKNLTLLSETERQSLFDRPRFDEFQRADYLAFSADELAIAQQRKGTAEQLLCMLQLGYFKATRAFFAFTADDCPDDAEFLRAHYFPQARNIPARPVRRAESLLQRQAILRLFGYRLCTSRDRPLLTDKARQLVRRDVTPAFVMTELVAWLDLQRIVRPGYTTFQSIISTVLGEERRRLAGLIEAGLTDEVR
jgi:hypothetical protein